MSTTLVPSDGVGSIQDFAFPSFHLPKSVMSGSNLKGSESIGSSLRTQRPNTFYENQNHQSKPTNASQNLLNEQTSKTRTGGNSKVKSVEKKPSSSQINQIPRQRQRKIQNEKTKIGVALLNKRQSVSYGAANARNKSSIVPPLPNHVNTPSTLYRLTSNIKNQSDQFNQSSNSILDLETLSKPNFDPENFIKIYLSAIAGGASDPQTLNSLKQSLRSTQSSTNRELQENTYKNYGAFVVISKEIATLENEMLELKIVLEEFKTLPNDLNMGLSPIEDNNGETKRKVFRNSIADVNALYKSQLESLWERVEGSQKFLAILPGRHIISESKTFIELHPITYQPKQALHLFLLNDSLLLAIQKRSAMGSNKVKLIAERCFNLPQISIIDLTDAPNLNNAIQIKSSGEKVILRTESNQEKRNLLNSFRKVTQELARKKRKQSIMAVEQRAPASEFIGGKLVSRGLSSQWARPNSHGLQPNKILGFGKDDKDLSWIGDLSDELAVAIACREFNEAIELIEKAKTILTQLPSNEKVLMSGLGSPSTPVGMDSYHILKHKIEEKSKEILDSLLEDLLNSSIKKSQLCQISKWIAKLSGGIDLAGFNHERAKQNFLSMRSKLVKKQIRNIDFDNDLISWISKSSFVLFSLIKNTCEWYMTAFKDNQMKSGFVKWAIEQIESVGKIFKIQIYNNQNNQDHDDEKIEEEIIQDAVRVIKLHGEMLKEVGLNFNFLLNNLLKKESNQKT
ncbi:hypothetical protein O181_028838 [Austropuccinia psidii MF-1]|uniref:Exocyst complex component EXO84 n=1 Tax=Austropuccinia psidii MF-1 TaxID=1389203 RepID=A0A9Q3CSE4_9BASI|nr:hypothetical protein [Austropuccinia psidii MF-1]